MKILIVFSLLVSFLFSGTHIAAEENNEFEVIMISDTENEYQSSIIDGKTEIRIIKNRLTNDITIERYYDNKLMKTISGNLERSTNDLSISQLAVEDYIESETGWGAYIPPSKYNFNAFTCPAEYVDEGILGSRYFEIYKGVNDQYCELFYLYLEEYLQCENDVNRLQDEQTAGLIKTAIVLAGAVCFGNPALIAAATMEALNGTTLVNEMNGIIADMAELQDGMAFYYRDLYVDRYK